MSSDQEWSEAGYLRIIDQLVECRDDKSLHRVQHVLQQFLHGNTTSAFSKDRLIEGYKSGEFEIHLHAGITPDAAFEQVNFCAVISGHIPGADNSVGPRSRFVDLGTAPNHRQVSVLVSVAQFLEESETIVDLPCFVVLT